MVTGMMMVVVVVASGDDDNDMRWFVKIFFR